MLRHRGFLSSILLGSLLLPPAPPSWGGVPAPAPPPASGFPAQGGAYVWADFDGDGYTDLAVGVPEESLEGKDDAGAVNVIYGTGRGLKGRGNQLWHQGRLEGELEAFDDFGTSLATGDFDGDGYTDLAVGAPGEGVDGADDAGAVNVIYGTRRGLRTRGNQLWHQGRLKGALEADDGFGSSLATGDFDGDGYTDLAVGLAPENLDGVEDAGAVNVIYGTARGLGGRGNQFWHQGRLGGTLGAFDFFGLSLAGGDFDGDGYADLAVGAPGEALDGNNEAGAVSVIYGTKGGLRARGSQFWHQGRLKGELEAADFFAFSLAAGDFDGDGHAELAIGVHNESLDPGGEAGAVNVIYGTRRGLKRRGNQLWHQGRLKGELEADDDFGWSLATGDFDGDGWGDLAVAARDEDLDGNIDAGAVNVIYGTGRGLRARGNQLWHQGRLKGALEADDAFGWRLAGGDFDGDGYADLAIAARFEDLGGKNAAGAVNVVYGTRRGLRSKGNQLWHQGRLKGELEANDRFGESLA